MNAMEIVVAAMALICMISSLVSLYFTYEWRLKVERECYRIEQGNMRAKQCANDVDTALFHVKEDLLELKNTFYQCGIETMKVRSEDHDQAIDSIRKDLLDLQVISGTLPSRAGTMLDEVNNTLEELKSLQSAYKEQQALLETTKEQVAKLAEAYAQIHFTGKEIEEMRDELEDLSRRTA